MLSIIAIIGKKRQLGKDNHLLWNIPDDLKHFRTITTAHPVIMGRRTYESMGKPLPNRTNIVISSNPSYQAEGITVVSSLEQAMTKAKDFPGNDEIFVVGGGKVYAQAIDLVDRLYLTLVDATAEADTFFPDYGKFTKIIAQEPHEENGIRYSYVTLEK